MSNDMIVYRSQAPVVLAGMGSFNAEFRVYQDQVRAVLRGCGADGRRVCASTSGWTPGRFLGLAPDEPLPDGWRLTKNCAVPDRRTAAGRRVAAALKLARHPGDPVERLPGMPADVLTGGGFSQPGLVEMGGWVWVTWRNTDPELAPGSFTSESASVDRSLWERVPLSLYWAAREARDAERAAVAS